MSPFSMGPVRTDIRYLLHLGRTTLGLVIGKISKRRASKKICLLGVATQKDLQRWETLGRVSQACQSPGLGSQLSGHRHRYHISRTFSATWFSAALSFECSTPMGVWRGALCIHRQPQIILYRQSMCNALTHSPTTRSPTARGRDGHRLSCRI